MPPVLDAALRELHRGHQPVSIPLGKKGPTQVEWHRIRYSDTSAPAAFGPGRNIGLLVGAPSNGLVDVDLDCDAAVQVASLVMPDTGMIHGRPTRPMSHRWYRVEAPPATSLQLKDPRDDKMLIELRSSDGVKAAQTVIPPSIHPVDQEPYTWESDGEPARISTAELVSQVKYVAAASMMARAFPANGRHKYCLALAGGLLRRGWDVTQTELFLTLVCEVGGSKDVQARVGVVAYTKSRLDSDLPCTGFNTVAELTSTAVVSRLCEWLGLNDSDGTTWTEESLTELGVAERLARQHAKSLFFVRERKEWFRWDGKRWAQDGSRSIWQYAIETIRSIGEDAQRKLDVFDRLLVETAREPKSKARTETLDEFDPTSVEAVLLAIKALAFSKSMETKAKIDAVVDLAASLPALSRAYETLDANPWLFNLDNGTLNLESGVFTPHAQDDYLTKLSPVVFDPFAKAPMFTAFLDTVLPDAEVREFVQRAHGYSLTGLTTEQCLFLCLGVGANGKSVLDKVRRNYMGEYGKVAEASSFSIKRGESVRNDLARLVGSRMVSVSETTKGKQLDESQVKSATSGDIVSARFLYKEFFEYVPQFKLWMSSNYRPEVRGNDDGIWRRIRVIPFDVKIPDDQQDRFLDAKITAHELPGVLNWALEGLKKWRQSGLGKPAAMNTVQEEYRFEADDLEEWFNAACQRGGTETAQVLYKSYSTFVMMNGGKPAR